MLPDPAIAAHIQLYLLPIANDFSGVGRQESQRKEHKFCCVTLLPDFRSHKNVDRRSRLNVMSLGTFVLSGHLQFGRILIVHFLGPVGATDYPGSWGSDSGS
jgi:hypothetical protein